MKWILILSLWTPQGVAVTISPIPFVDRTSCEAAGAAFKAQHATGLGGSAGKFICASNA